MPDISYPGVYIEEVSVPHSIAGVATSVTAFVGSTPSGPIDQPTRLTSFVEFERAFDAASATTPLGVGVRLFFLNGGKAAVVVRTTGSPAPTAPDATGIYALEAEDFNLLCLPELGADGPPTDPAETAAALAAASRLCEARRAILIVDPLPSWHSAADVVSGPAGLATVTAGMRRANAAVYFPRLAAAGGGAPQELAPSGAVAGIIARSDLTRGVWRAPAGQDATIAGAGGLATTLSQGEARSLNRLGVNTLRTFHGAGTVVWGARTLDGADATASEWKYLPVRRMALFIEESLSRGLAWAVFEPNDEVLWATIRNSVGWFLYALFKQGAFQGVTPSDAFFVKCDRDSTTQQEIDAGIVNIVVGIAPLKPAEFVILQIRLMAGSA
jgi:phage tail sheath protein FI